MPHYVIEDKDIPTGPDKLIPSRLPLFNPNTLSPGKNDIRQRYIGCCYLDAALQSIVSCDPDLIRQMFVDETEDTVTVKLYDDNGDECFYTIDKSILCDSANKPLQAHAYLWPHVLEKAIALHYRQDKGDNLRQMLTAGRPSNVFSVCLAHRAGIKLQPAHMLIMGEMVYRQFPVDKNFEKSSIQQKLNKSTIEHDWMDIGEAFNNQLNELNELEKKSVLAAIKLYDGLLPSGKLDEVIKKLCLSQDASEVLKNYCDILEDFWIKYISTLCENGTMMVVSHDGKHEYTINRVIIEDDGSKWVELRNPWGFANNQQLAEDRGIKKVTLDDFLLKTPVLTTCDKRQCLYNNQLPEPTLTLHGNPELAALYANNIIQSMAIKDMALAEKSRVAKVIGAVLSQSALLVDINQSQSVFLQASLADLIMDHRVVNQSFLAYFSLGVIQSSYSTIDTSKEGLNPAAIGDCIDEIQADVSLLYV